MKHPILSMILAGTLLATAGCGLGEAKAPSIQITSGETEIAYMQGEGAAMFETIMADRATTDLPYFPLDSEIRVVFPGGAPDSIELSDYVLGADGKQKYGKPESVSVELDGDTAFFTLAVNWAAMLSSDLDDYEPGAITRGFLLTCAWEEQSYEYAFIVRTDIRSES